MPKLRIKWRCTHMVNRDDLTGIEYVEALRDSLIPLSPMAQNIGWRIDKVSFGEVILKMTPAKHLLNNFTVHGGALATILDGAMSAAVNSTLDRGARARTVDLNVTFLQAPRIEDGELLAKGTVIQTRRTLAAAEARIEDKNGKLFAHGKAVFYVQQPSGDKPE